MSIAEEVKACNAEKARSQDSQLESEDTSEADWFAESSASSVSDADIYDESQSYHDSEQVSHQFT